MALCPNCSAVLEKVGQIQFCEYCGYSEIGLNHKKIQEIKDFSFKNDIIQQRDIILSSQLINVKNWSDDCISLIMANDYSPRIKFKTYDGIKIRIEYSLSSSEEEILSFIIKSETKRNFPIISINTEYGEFILNDFDTSLSNVLKHRISLYEFFFICNSDNDSVKINTNLISQHNDSPNFDEFIHYCRRFYNQCINYRMFIYAINKRLICDM